MAFSVICWPRLSGQTNNGFLPGAERAGEDREEENTIHRGGNHSAGHRMPSSCDGHGLQGGREPMGKQKTKRLLVGG